MFNEIFSWHSYNCGVGMWDANPTLCAVVNIPGWKQG